MPSNESPEHRLYQALVCKEQTALSTEYYSENKCVRKLKCLGTT
jgi:hypothetical protein